MLSALDRPLFLFLLLCSVPTYRQPPRRHAATGAGPRRGGGLPVVLLQIT